MLSVTLVYALCCCVSFHLLTFCFLRYVLTVPTVRLIVLRFWAFCRPRCTSRACRLTKKVEEYTAALYEVQARWDTLNSCTTALDVGALWGSGKSEDREGGLFNLEGCDQNVWSDTGWTYSFKAWGRTGAWTVVQMWSLGALCPHL